MCVFSSLALTVCQARPHLSTAGACTSPLVVFEDTQNVVDIFTVLGKPSTNKLFLSVSIGNNLQL